MVLVMPYLCVLILNLKLYIHSYVYTTLLTVRYEHTIWSFYVYFPTGIAIAVELLLNYISNDHVVMLTIRMYS